MIHGMRGTPNEFHVDGSRRSTGPPGQPSECSEHSIITAIWHMLTDNVPYHELGGTYFAQRDPERATHHAITALNQLGYTVTLNPIEDAAWHPAPGHPAATTATGHSDLPANALNCTYLRVRGLHRWGGWDS